MIEQVVFELQGERLATGELYLYAKAENGRWVDPQRLKPRLFAWDKRSYYGSMIETVERNRTAGLLVSPYVAIAFLAAPRLSRHVAVQWSEDLLQWQQVARVFMTALAEGWFMPSFDRWMAGRAGWKLLLPEREQRPSTLEWDAFGEDTALWDEWFDAFVQDLLSQEPEVAEAFAHVQQEHQAVVSPYETQFDKPDQKFIDEERWLIAIGWKRDMSPFQVSFQLVEPMAEEESWNLRLVLQDRDDARLLRETDLQGRPLEGDLPAHWQETVAPRTSQEVTHLFRIMPWLDEALTYDHEHLELSDEQAWRFLQESAELVAAGCSLLLPAWWDELRARRPRLKAKVKSSVGSAQQSLFGLDQIVQFDWKVAVGDLELSEAEFLRLLAEGKRLMLIRGQWVHLDQAFLNQVMRTVSQSQKRNGLSLREVLERYWQEQAETEVRLERSAGVETEEEAAEWEDFRFEVELNDHLQQFVDQLQAVSSLPLVTPPAELNAQLRHYQMEGVSWLLFLRKYGLGGCLADDMGLGKTIQFIAYLLCARQEQTKGPALLICPTSVMGNWEKELQRFAPTLQVYVHYGAQRAKGDLFPEQTTGVDLVITSYTLAHLDQEELTAIRWNAICLDEAQHVKNAHTKQRIAIRKLDAHHRIALTGTPIENRLTELWSIFDFLNPGYLGSLSTFTATYVNHIEKHDDPLLIAQVKQLIRPFLLRRVKKDPAIQLDLPEKNEMKTYVSLTADQGVLYENLVQDLFDKLETVSGMEKRGLILGALTKLKQICDHPALFLKEATITRSDARSHKLERLVEMVEELRAEGEKCLIFTQYVEMGTLLKQRLEEQMGEAVLFLHGGVPKAKRDQLVARFQEEEDAIFVLSLKAGGTGLNLTAANHVFHFDRWWNPAVEDQATDRAFRIGQTRDVQVHKFVTLGTLEERIDEMIERKQGLNRQIVGNSEQWITEMSTEDLKDLFALRKEWVGK